MRARPLRVVLVWHGEALEERVFAEPALVTVGAAKGDTFIVPSSRLGDGFPLFRPSPDETGYLLTLANGMSGKLNLGRQSIAVDHFLREGHGVPAGAHREQPLAVSDWGIIALDDEGNVAFFFQFIAPGAVVGPSASWIDRFLGQALLFSFIVCMGLLVTGFLLWEPRDDLDLDPPPSVAIAKMLFDKPPEEPEPKRRAEARKVREQDASKRAANKEGKVGEKDAKVAETKIPKGEKDQIVKKVSSLGLLGTLKASKQSAALKSLLSDTPDATMTTAMAGLKGAELVVGRGSGGMGTRGEGPGGGGTGKGQLLGVGNLAVGSGGKGKHGTGSGGGLGPGHEAKELKVAMTTGAPSSDGGLSKEQILKVVQSHAAAIQFCYEKELQRFPHLAGKVVLGWKVNLDGRVEAVKVDSSSLGNPSAEGCMARQVKNWQFPKPNGVVCLVSFPFFFKGQ